jgi:hypothetical protein
MARRFGLGVVMIPSMIVPTLTRHDLLIEMLASIDYPVGLLVIVNNHPSRDFEAFGWVPDVLRIIGC